MPENYGDILARKVAQRIRRPVAAETDLDTIPADSRVDGMLCVVGTGASREVWAFAADDTSPEVAGAVRAPGAGTGTWRKVAGGAGGSGGVDWKDSVLAATTANITLSGAQTIDGVSVVAGDRVLVKNQSTGSQNGIYIAATGAWSRAPDADTSAKVTPNLAVQVERGSINADKIFELDVDAAITLGTTALTFIDFRGLATTAPADVTKAAAAVGTATTVARADHKHDIATAAATGLTSASTNTEGAGAEVARALHTHAITALNIASAGTAAAKSAGALAAADFAIPTELILTVPAGTTADLDFTAAPFAFRVLDCVARKVGTSADAGDTVALQTGAGSAITNTMGLNVTGNVLVRATSIDPTTHEIAAAGTLRARRVQSTDAACVLHVKVVRIP